MFLRYRDFQGGGVAFGPLSDSAAMVYREVIRQHAPDQPLIAIAYSRLHTDHIATARVLRRQFGKDVPSIAHERVLRYFQRYKTPLIDLPTETVTDTGRVYKFGIKTVDLRYVGDAHTASSLVHRRTSALGTLRSLASESGTWQLPERKLTSGLAQN